MYFPLQLEGQALRLNSTFILRNIFISHSVLLSLNFRFLLLRSKDKIPSSTLSFSAVHDFAPISILHTCPQSCKYIYSHPWALPSPPILHPLRLIPLLESTCCSVSQPFIAVYFLQLISQFL